MPLQIAKHPNRNWTLELTCCNGCCPTVISKEHRRVGLFAFHFLLFKPKTVCGLLMVTQVCTQLLTYRKPPQFLRKLLWVRCACVAREGVGGSFGDLRLLKLNTCQFLFEDSREEVRELNSWEWVTCCWRSLSAGYYCMFRLTQLNSNETYSNVEQFHQRHVFALKSTRAVFVTQWPLYVLTWKGPNTML